MKRKLLSVLFTLSMIACLCGALALTSYATDYVASVYDTDGTTLLQSYESIQDAIDAAANGITSIDNARTVKILKDVYLSETIKIKEDGDSVTEGKQPQIVIIDLNDHMLNGKNILHEGSIIYNQGIVSIVDKSEKESIHYFTYYKNYNSSNANARWILNTTATEGIEVSEITSNTPEGTVIKIHGGLITQARGYDGGAIVNDNGIFTLDGISIVGNCAYYGSAIYTITNENVTGDVASTIKNTLIFGNQAYIDGAIIGKKTTHECLDLKIIDSKIKFNMADNFCGVAFCNIMVGGSTEITDNIMNRDYTNVQYNTVLFNNTITLGTKTGESPEQIGNGVPVPEEGMKIGVTFVAIDDYYRYYSQKLYYSNRIDTRDRYDTENLGVFTRKIGKITSNGQSEDIDYFFSDLDCYDVIFVNDHFELDSDYIAEVNFGNETKQYKHLVDALYDVRIKSEERNITNIEDALIVKLIKDAEIVGNIYNGYINTDGEQNVAHPGYVIIDLNGHILKSFDHNSYIQNNSDSVLKIIDTDKTTPHYFNYDKHNAWSLNTTATSGIEVNDITSDTEKGTVIKINGGVITGCSWGNSAYIFSWYCIYNKGSLITDNINIVGNYTVDGPIYNYGSDNSKARATLKDTSVFGNKGWGGVIDNSYADIVIIGGSIRFNSSEAISTIWYNERDESVTIGGNAVIKDNSPTNVLVTSTPITIGTKTGENPDQIGNGVPAPEEGMEVGITIYRNEIISNTTGTFTTNGSADDVQYFFSDIDKYWVVFEDDHLEIAGDICKVDFGGATGEIKYSKVQEAINEAANAYTSESGAKTVTLLEDIYLEKTLTVAKNQNAILDLNGKVLYGGASSSVIINNGTLTIDDTYSYGYHYFDYIKDGLWTFSHSVGQIGISDITSDTPNRSYVKIPKGVIMGGKAEKGGAILNSNTLTVKNVNLIGNSAVSGGAIYNTNDGQTQTTVTIDNCIICGNTATGGGAICSEVADITVIDSKIMFNTATYAAGIITRPTATIKVGGDVVISDNKTPDGKKSDVFITNNITLGTGTDISKGGNGCPVPGSNMKIGVIIYDENNNPTTGRFTTNGTAEDVSRFFSDDSKYSVYYVSKGGYLELDTAKIAQVDFGTGIGIKQYSDLQTAIDEASEGVTDSKDARTVELLKDIEITETLTVKGDDETTSDTDETQHVVLNLNGFVLNGDSTSSVITNNGTLTIKDSGTTEHYFKYSANGKWLYIANPEESQKNVADPIYAIDNETTVVKVTGGCITGGIGEISGDGGGVANKGIFTLESGNIVGNSSANDNTCHGGGVANSNNGSFVMNGGCIIGNYSYHGGGGIFNYAGTVTVNSGSVLFNIAKESGGGIGNDGTLIIEGGLISKNTSGNIGGGIYTSGGRYVNIKDVGQIFIPGSSLTVGGYAKVYDNIGVKGNNLAAYEGNLLNIGTSYDGTDGNEVLKPAYGMCVYVTLLANDTENPTSGAFTTNGSVYDVYYFFSDDGYKVIFNKDHLELSDGIVEITDTTYGIIPENDIDAATAKSRASKSEKTKDLASGIVAYAKVNGQYRCVVKSEGGEWTAVDKLYTFEELKNETNAFVIGMKSDFCYVTTRGIYEGSGLTLYVGEDGKEEKIGIFTIEKQSNGSYYIYETVYEEGTPEKHYLSLDTTTKNETYSSSPSEWKCDSTGLYQEVTKTVKTRILFFYRTKKSTEKVYLTKNGSTAVKVKEVFETHFYRTPQLDSNDGHYATHHLADCVRCEYSALQQHFFNDNGVCTNCGYEKNKTYAIRGIDVNIETKVVSRKLADIIKGKNKAYTVKVTPYGDEGVYATDVKYKLDIDADWIDGDSFVTYNSEFEVFVSVTDNNGETTEWYYSNKKKK